ncbi:type II toxin-antitoxin system RelB/DinJ family antitoxin [Desulfovibrio legallii]|jgi:DNA-damage-inducible protein J|uniref:DNA-damage-inducible protein J n=1 Tax=Desulfovibrio legallii TaxID=571438 RepID=A0A1G7IMR8_9BACT|nr:type II toxin-antitoxin system RelB/DinJ family antitoxin [Desulfovibrio legallii]SDF14027.1 DNA-damage-inducible protein J [Desulfovibrio legallii]
MANLQIRLDDALKAQAQAVTADLGLDVATAVRMFLVQMVRERALPFTPSLDPFYSPQNQAHLARLAQDMDAHVRSACHPLMEPGHETPLA